MFTLPTPLDMMHLPAQFSGDVQVFITNNQGNLNWQTWVKPRGITMCYILAISGGGGGGGGFQRSAGNPGGGGGGGSGGCTNAWLAPAFLLPAELYIQVGVGGLGVTSGTGGSGGATNVSLGRSNAIPNVILKPGGGAGGGSGTAGAGGGGGGGSTSSVGGGFVTLGFTSSGQNGDNGQPGGAQTGAAGTSQSSVWNAKMTCPGAGGAGCTTTDFAGGAINLQGTPDFVALSVPGGVAPGGSGGSVQLWEPYGMTGGSGGASNNSGVAGNGGNGGIGCGGGGGGAGATGGRGGNGGNGMVLIISW